MGLAENYGTKPETRSFLVHILWSFFLFLLNFLSGAARGMPFFQVRAVSVAPWLGVGANDACGPGCLVKLTGSGISLAQVSTMSPAASWAHLFSVGRCPGVVSRRGPCSWPALGECLYGPSILPTPSLWGSVSLSGCCTLA